MNAPVKPQTANVIVADASQVSSAEFMRAVFPRPSLSPTEELCARLWDAAKREDREEIRRIHEQIEALKPAELQRQNRGGWRA